jgi:phosphotransferase system enzyme I (PtsI)
MIKLIGKGVSPGIAIGEIRIYKKTKERQIVLSISEPVNELQRLNKARVFAKDRIKELYRRTEKEAGESAASIFAAQLMILEDPEYLGYAERLVREERVNAEYAVSATANYLAQKFEAMDDDYMKARAADIRDISEHLMAGLTGGVYEKPFPDEPFILLAHDLSPSETAKLDRKKVLAFVTKRGSVHSHTSILARTFGIPALVRVSIPADETESLNGKIAVVDGTEGVLYIDPDGETLAFLREKQESLKKQEVQKAQEPSRGADDKKPKIYANISDPQDIEAAQKTGAAGIGLFRSEFIFLGRESAPTEGEQFEIYRRAAQKMAGKPVVIRTLDIGADKKCSYLNLEQEENPALGVRAIRICLKDTELFKTQLRALFRAGVYGDIRVLYPMITGVEEIRQIKEIVNETALELKEQGRDFKIPKQGIMIETPAAAIMSDELSKEVDFFSIGTNDLTQYALAADRQNPNLDEFYDKCHPAVMRLIKMTVENAKKVGITVAICGDLAGDASLTAAFAEMGVDELSVPSILIPNLLKI